MPLPPNHAERMRRARLSLQGLSVGDAFGERFFVNPSTVESLIEQRAIPRPPWRCTDDTIMAASIVDVLEACALSHAGRHEEAIALAEPVIRQLRDPMLPFFAGRLVTDLVAVGRVDDARALLQNLHLTPAQVPLDDATSARLGEAD